jgi:uncharacterized membrane protein
MGGVQQFLVKGMREVEREKRIRWLVCNSCIAVIGWNMNVVCFSSVSVSQEHGQDFLHFFVFVTFERSHN